MSDLANSIFRSAINQLRADQSRIQAETLIREALDALTNQDSTVNLKDWEREARRFLRVA